MVMRMRVFKRERTLRFLRDLLLSLGVLAATTLLAYLLHRDGLTDGFIPMLFVLAVLLIANYAGNREIEDEFIYETAQG